MSSKTKKINFLYKHQTTSNRELPDQPNIRRITNNHLLLNEIVNFKFNDLYSILNSFLDIDNNRDPNIKFFKYFSLFKTIKNDKYFFPSTIYFGKGPILNKSRVLGGVSTNWYPSSKNKKTEIQFNLCSQSLKNFLEFHKVDYYLSNLVSTKIECDDIYFNSEDFGLILTLLFNFHKKILKDSYFYVRGNFFNEETIESKETITLFNNSTFYKLSMYEIIKVIILNIYSESYFSLRETLIMLVDPKTETHKNPNIFTYEISNGLKCGIKYYMIYDSLNEKYKIMYLEELFASYDILPECFERKKSLFITI